MNAALNSVGYIPGSRITVGGVKPAFLSYIEISPNIASIKGDFEESFEDENFESIGWNIVNPDNDRTFQRTEQAAFTGAAAIYYNNVNGNPSDLTDQLIAPGIDISGMNDPKLTFKMAYARRSNTSQDRLSVFLSDNCGLTWKVRFSRGGGQLETTSGPIASTFFPASNEWEEHEISLSAIEGATNGLVRFDFTSGGGNNLFIDDINIYDANPSTSIADVEARKLNVSLAPNPFNNKLNVKFTLDQSENVTIEVLDITGRTLNVIQRNLTPGEQNIELKAQENNFSQPGVYFVRLRTSKSTVTKNVLYKN